MIVPPVDVQVAHAVVVVAADAVHPTTVAIAIDAIDANIDIQARFRVRKRVFFFYAKIKPMGAKYSTTDYRYPYEYFILVATIMVVLLVIAFTAAATVCTSAIFVPLVVIYGYFASRSKHQALLAQAQQVTPQTAPEMIPLIKTNSCPPASGTGECIYRPIQPAECLYLRDGFTQGYRALLILVQDHGSG